MSGEPESPDRPRPAAFFDLDKTVLAAYTPMLLARPFLAAGLLTRAGIARSAWAQLGYVFLAADHRRSERVRGQLSRMVAGWEVTRLQEVVELALDTAVSPYVYLEAVELISQHHRAGHDVVIVSASAEDVVRPVARMLLADDVVASRMHVADGRYTGAIDYYAYGATKAAAVRDLARHRGYDLARSFAYSDSITDLPMLEAVGHPVAVNPHRDLRRIAVSRGWEVRDFARPVPLRAWFPRPVDARVTVVAVLAATAVTAAAVLTALATGRRFLRRSRR
ncbi:HAD family phosphatase [Georgenia sp. SYP-B2076]|uniref:HAD family hydrolase n=1 Tax=Georgenia sp. SYP-B2076 TaxID=2495881 RepID=UPI000F8E6CE1|nr:HAD-IB family hydrolase [Georgenia sp. SYP-B2076]